MQLAELPDDIIIDLLICLDPSSLVRFRQSCRYIYNVSLVKQLWVSLYSRDVVQRGLPVAYHWKSVEVLTSKQVEHLVLHTWRLEQRLSHGLGPVVDHPFHQPRSVTWVQLIRSQWLLVASSDDVVSVITLWSVSSLLRSSLSSPLAEAFLPAPVSTGIVDTTGPSIILALELCGRTPQIYFTTIMADGENMLFCHLQTLTKVAKLRCLRGNYICASLINNLNIPSIVDWTAGSGYRVLPLPDLQGGAAAMHMNEDWVAAVRRSVVEIYKGNGQCFDAWKTIPLAHTVGCASFAELNDDRSTLRLFITSTDGLFVYDIVCNPSDELLSLTPIWHYVEPDTEDHDPVLTQGLIGVTTKALSWVHGCMMDRSFRLRFVHAAIPVGDQPPTLFEWHDPNMSVLHAYGVYDFDETRGILVIGNVYGELAIYDFSGSDPSWFDGCLASDLEAMPYTDEKLLSLEPILSYPAPPFPYWESPEYIQDDLVQYWQDRGLPVIPPGWSNDFSDEEDGWLQLFSGRGAGSPRFVWDLDCAAHFYGRPIPLLHKFIPQTHLKIVIYDIGGLLFIADAEEPLFHTVDPSIMLDELVETLDQGNFPGQHLVVDVSGGVIGFWFKQLEAYERKMGIRDRCLELSLRGGRVNSRFLKMFKPEGMITSG